MEQQGLASRSARAVAGAVGRSLRIRGFFRRRDGLYYRLYHGVCHLVRIDGTPAGPPTWKAMIQVALATLPLEASQRDTEGDVDANGGELSLWDLIPQRERGGAWAVTGESSLEAVAADVVEALERYGLPRLEGIEATEPRQLPRQRLPVPDVDRRMSPKRPVLR